MFRAAAFQIMLPNRLRHHAAKHTNSCEGYYHAEVESLRNRLCDRRRFRGAFPKETGGSGERTRPFLLCPEGV